MAVGLLAILTVTANHTKPHPHNAPGMTCEQSTPCSVLLSTPTQEYRCTSNSLTNPAWPTTPTSPFRQSKAQSKEAQRPTSLRLLTRICLLPLLHTDEEPNKANHAHNSTDRILFDRVIVLIRPPCFHQLPRTAVGRVANIIMIS